MYKCCVNYNYFLRFKGFKGLLYAPFLVQDAERAFARLYQGNGIILVPIFLKNASLPYNITVTGQVLKQEQH